MQSLIVPHLFQTVASIVRSVACDLVTVPDCHRDRAAERAGPMCLLCKPALPQEDKASNYGRKCSDVMLARGTCCDDCGRLVRMDGSVLSLSIEELHKRA